MGSHKITIDTAVSVPDDGLMLGNGDLSVSFYQRPGRLIWRFGKNDFWDRRIDYHLDPRPAHVEEMIRGIRDERWCCGPYGGPVEALNGSADPGRMREICQGVPPSNLKRGYPCPKPAGELALFYPSDPTGMRLTQTLDIEAARLQVECAWTDGLRLRLTAFVAPEDNALVVSGKLTGWNARRAFGEDYLPPFWFRYYRDADPDVAEFGARYETDYRVIFPAFSQCGGEPMEPPTVETLSDGTPCVEQLFPADPTYPEGFTGGLAAIADGFAAEVFPANRARACVTLLPSPGQREFRLTAAVESGENAAAMRRKLAAALAIDRRKAARDNAAAARRFWSRSAVSLPGAPAGEELWYANWHARRCAYRRGALPPGLFFPSTLRDYSLWHGDFHMNYNFQQPFYGDYSGNHPEVGDSYFVAMKPILALGRLIAERYYGSSGTFIQLSGYPVKPLDDVLGCAPMGRMVYATGWAGHQYWWRYRYTMDKGWLAAEGYPVLKSLAQFYLDFLKEGEDGLFHAFPSNQGEDGFSGNPAAYADLPQILLHTRFALAAARAAAAEIGVDPEFRTLCGDRIGRLAPPRRCASGPRPAVDNWEETAQAIDREAEAAPLEWAEILRGRGDLFPPEFLGFDGRIRGFASPQPPDHAAADGYPRRWYAGKLPSLWLTELRNRTFRPERDWPELADILRRWRCPNGLLRGMAVAMYGHCGAYTETTGIVAPIQECLLDSSDGVIRIFAGAPAAWGDAAFSGLRAEGAFLVSARRQQGRTAEVILRSEVGGAVALADPFAGRPVIVGGAELKREGRVWRGVMRRGQVWTAREKQP